MFDHRTWAVLMPAPVLVQQDAGFQSLVLVFTAFTVV